MSSGLSPRFCANAPSLPNPDQAPALPDQTEEYRRGIFINCPFDDAYKPIRDALIFTAFACGLKPRCALEYDNSVQTRLDKIVDLIGACRWGIHDLSRVRPVKRADPPHFNMPFELGLFFGAHRFGDEQQKFKSCLVLVHDTKKFQQACSNLNGQDPVAHASDPKAAVEAVRNWLQGELRRTGLDKTQKPLRTGDAIFADYRAFRDKLPDACRRLGGIENKLTFVDYCDLVSNWLA